jgi:hypothetical protein
MALGCAAATQARADSITDYVHLELGAGVSRYRPMGDGTWYQAGMPHSLGLSAPVLSAGFTGPVWRRESWGVDWHVDYVNLGHVHSSCSCTTDDNYDAKSHRELSNPPPAPNADFIGNGNAQGVALTLEPYYLYRGWRIGVEVGLYPYRPSWSETVYGWTPSWSVPGRTVVVNTPHAWQIGKVVGLSVGRGPLSIEYQHYWLPTRYTDESPPAIWGAADVLMVKYRF